MAYDAGQAFLQVVPSFAGVVDAIVEEFSKDGEVAGEAFKTAFDGATRDLSASVGLDTRPADERLAELTGEIRALHESVGVNISDSEALAKVEFLKAELDSLHGSIDVGTGAGLAAELEAIKVAADDASGSGNASGGLAGLAASAGEAGAGISPMIPLLGLLGIALLPIAGLAAGALATLPAIFAGIGSGVGALYLGLSGVIPALQAYEGTLNTTGKTAAQVTTAHNQLANAMAGLSPAGQTFVAFVGSQLLPMFESLKNAVQSALLPGLTAGLQAMVPLFQALEPFITNAATGIGNFVAGLGKMLTQSADLQEIKTIFFAGSAFMQQVGEAANIFIEALLQIASQATPFLSQIGQGIINLAAALANWVQNGGFENFMHWLLTNAPIIVKQIVEFVGGFGKLLIALLPVGDAIIQIVGPLGEMLGFLAKTPALLVGVTLGIGALGIALAVAMDSNPVGLIITAIALLIIGVVELVTHWSQIWGEIKHVFDEAVTFLRSGFGTLALMVLGPVGMLAILALHWQQIWAVMKTAASLFVNFFKTAGRDIASVFTTVVEPPLHVLQSIWGVVWEAMKIAIQIAKVAITVAIDLILIPIAILVRSTQAMIALWTAVWNAVAPVVSAAWGIVEPILSAIGSAIAQVFGTAESVISAVMSAIWSIFSTVWNAISPLVSSVLGVVGSVISGGMSLISSVISTTLGVISAVWSTIWGGLSSAVSTAWSVVTSIVSIAIAAIAFIINGIGSALSTVADAVSAPFKLAFDAIKTAWNNTVGGFGFTIPSWVPFVGGDSFHIPNMHTGGIVPGPPGADVPIMMQAGELVISRPDLSMLAAASGGTSQPQRILNQNFQVQAFDPRSAAIEMQQRSDYAAKTRGF